MSDVSISLGSRFDSAASILSRVLSKFGRDVRQVKRVKDILFRLAWYLVQVAGQGVFVQRQTALDGPCQRKPNVVLLAPGEVLEREWKRLVGDHSQVGIQDDSFAADRHGRDDARLRLAMPDHLHYFRQAHKSGHDRLRILSARENVDVLGRLAPTAHASRTTPSGSRPATLSCSSKRQAQGKRLIEANALAHLAEERDPFQYLGLRLARRTLLRPATRLSWQAASSAATSAMVRQVVVHRLHLLRAEAGDAQHLLAFRRELACAARSKAEFARLHQRRDLLDQRLADAANLAELPATMSSFRSPSNLLNGCRRVIGVAAKGVLALQFQQGADLFQRGGNIVFGHARVCTTANGDVTVRAGVAVTVRQSPFVLSDLRRQPFA